MTNDVAPHTCFAANYRTNRNFCILALKQSSSCKKPSGTTREEHGRESSCIL